MKTNGLLKVILYVQDMDTQVRFYRDRLGLNVSYPQDLQDYSQEFWVTLEAGACTLALHGGGKGRLSEDSPKIVFGVEDIETARQELLAGGVKLGNVRQAAPGVKVCDGRDPEGNPFSIETRA
jgi:catechol 2,3-dioxygenase-like lactoylglutathione lyase family enzyme